MLKTLSLAAALAFGGAGSALALTPVPLPAPAVPDGGVTLVRDGCGPGGWRDGYGYCHGWRPVYRPVYRPRACPWGWHLGPYGRRCFPN